MTDRLDKIILEAHDLVENVYRDLGIESARRLPHNSNAVSAAERQIAHLHDVMNSVDQNLSMHEDVPDANDIVPVLDQTAPEIQQQNTVQQSSSSSGRQQNTPPRQQQNDPVVIDLCADSPKNDDVVLVAQIVPDVIDLDSPNVEERRRSHQRSRLAVERNEPRDRSRSPNVVTIELAKAAEDQNTGSSVGLQCPICMENYVKREPVTTKCGHIFCQQCIRQAIHLSQKCPICKRKLSCKGLIRVYI